MIGPVIMEVAGDVFIEGARILAIIWTGATTAGDTVEIRHRTTPENVIWKARTADTNTYLGLNIGPNGVHAPTGFRLTQISAGQVLIYIREQ